MLHSFLFSYLKSQLPEKLYSFSFLISQVAYFCKLQRNTEPLARVILGNNFSKGFGKLAVKDLQ